MAVDYEKGVPKNLVQFSEYNDLAFTDTGININDNSRPSKNTLWSSDRIEKRIREVVGGGNAPRNFQLDNPTRLLQRMNPDMMTPEDEYYTNGYKRYWNEDKKHLPRVFRPSWWLSWVIPDRQHYCDKCCNYMKHKWATSWNDDLSLSTCNCATGGCPKPIGNNKRSQCSR